MYTIAKLSKFDIFECKRVKIFVTEIYAAVDGLEFEQI